MLLALAAGLDGFQNRGPRLTRLDSHASDGKVLIGRGDLERGHCDCWFCGSSSGGGWLRRPGGWFVEEKQKPNSAAQRQDICISLRSSRRSPHPMVCCPGLMQRVSRDPALKFKLDKQLEGCATNDKMETKLDRDQK